VIVILKIKKNILKINENMNMNMRQIANRLQRYDYDMRRQKIIIK